MKKFLALMLVLLISVSISACVSKESSTSPTSTPSTSTTQQSTSETSGTSSVPSETTATQTQTTTTINKADIINAIEKVEKYGFTVKYSTILEGNTQITSRGGFDYSKGEAFWEIISKSGDFITYSNETVWDDSVYYSALVKQDNEIVQKGEVTSTIEDYFEKVLKGHTEIATPEEFRQWLFKGPDPIRNPLYYVRDLLTNANSVTTIKEGSNYVVTFTFTKEERTSINSVQKVIVTQGTGRLWLQNNLPTKGEIEITRTTSYEGLEESTTTSNARIEFEIAYTYQSPEWVAEVTG
ncbi:hypothetical protein [Thermococcus alcaliphilus]|uniref:hypothetical protein n=1 Tax=Thermococcus alcaliphilus TaxID=139207 RepID=UPI002091C8CF|nr:hypothetical protein [Thermococcus alcaliphilus]MCO6041169.1 hypothetical protein [Thermococcus alcaliphilus]